MTKFLNPELAASKTSRKKRQEAPRSSDSAGTERAMATLRRALEKQTKKADNQDRLRAKAINATMPEFIAALDEETLAPFFFALERLATAANRRRIATHPLRPEVVDEMHEEADEEEAFAAQVQGKEGKTVVGGKEPSHSEASNSQPGAGKGVGDTAV